MNLAALQQEFMRHVLAEDRPLPGGWDARMGAGLAIYRSAYRARLVDALAETFPRTRQWLGEALFDTAAAHHLILHPPASWTLDMAGDRFAETLVELFANDTEVPDLAWLEWAMHLAFASCDCEPLDPAGFAAATAAFGEEDWDAMRIGFVPALYIRKVRSDCAALWQALGQALGRGEAPAAAPMLGEASYCLVWREGLAPVFALAPLQEGDILVSMCGGASFGEVCARLNGAMPPEEAATTAGGMLGQWLARGLIAGLTPVPARLAGLLSGR